MAGTILSYFALLCGVVFFAYALRYYVLTAAVIVHDYGTVLSTVAFLFVFWAIAHKTILRRG